jgi:histidyl-tRNA synthetase
VPFAVVVGPDEAANGVVQLKRLATGEQWTLTVDEAIARVRA